MRTRGHRNILVAVLLAMLLAAAGLAVGGPTAQAAQQEAAESTGAEATTADWVQVSAGGDHSCGIRVSGKLYCWGDDSAGQIGNGAPLSDQPTPVEVSGGFTDWTAVTTGAFHTCALRAIGSLYCWGDDALNQLGDAGPAADQPAPVPVAGGAFNFTSVDAGLFHTCGRQNTGALQCWGFDGSGQLGNGLPLGNQIGPVNVIGGNWTSVSAGNFHTCGRKATGRLFCWGEDGSGQLGNGAPLTDRPGPVQVAGGAVNWTIVSAGGAHTCARKATGRLFCWGNDGQGQVGDAAPLANRAAPVQVSGAAINWTTVSAGNFHTCARKATGRLFCWGDDFRGALGNAAPLLDQSAPVQVAGNITNWRGVSSGGSHTCARRATSRIFCWGEDVPNGQLGNAPTGNQSAPVQVSA